MPILNREKGRERERERERDKRKKSNRIQHFHIDLLIGIIGRNKTRHGRIPLVLFCYGPQKSLPLTHPPAMEFILENPTLK